MTGEWWPWFPFTVAPPVVPPIVPQYTVTFQSKPHVCPICNGSGHVERYSNPRPDTTQARMLIYSGPCNGCSGRGIVWQP